MVRKIKSPGTPVDIDKFKFTNYINPDGTNTDFCKTYRSTLEYMSSETERLFRMAINNYNGKQLPSNYLRFEFRNLNNLACLRDLVGPSAEQGVKDAKNAIYQRQKELIDVAKNYTIWDGDKNMWIKPNNIKESSNGPRYVTRDIVNKTNSQKLKDAYDKGELEVLINGDIWYTERCPNGLGKELKAEMKRLYPNIKHLYGESSNKSANSSILSPNRLVQWAVGILFDMDRFVMDVYDNESWLIYGVGDGEFEETTTQEAKDNYTEHDWLVTDIETGDFSVEDFTDFLNTFKSATSNKRDYDQAERQNIISEAEDLLNTVKMGNKDSVNESNSKNINEETQLKRIARYGEFDNGHVLHNWNKMSSEEAEEKAKQASLQNPNDIYYVAYDDIMDSSSDLRWINGKSYNYSDVEIKGGKPHIKNTDSNSTINESKGLESWTDNEIADYIINRFKNITGIKISDVYNTTNSDDALIFDQSVIDKSGDKLINFLDKHGITGKRQEDLLYLIDDKLTSLQPNYIKEYLAPSQLKENKFNEDYSDEVVTLSRYLDVEVPDICRGVLDLIEHLPSRKIMYVTKICRDFYANMESIIKNYITTGDNFDIKN